MKKNLSLFSLILLCHLFSESSAQTVLSFPIIGDTIDHNEKVKYLLFDDISNDNHLFSVVSKNGSDTLITHYSKSDTSSIKINKKFIASIHNNIYKLDAYYSSMETKNYSDANTSILVNSGKSSETEDQIKKMDKLLKKDPNIKEKRKKATPEEKEKKKYLRGDPKYSDPSKMDLMLIESYQQSLGH
jgi:hypothetical protein